jgi:rhodanese-related sulfurtransferase
MAASLVLIAGCDTANTPRETAATAIALREAGFDAKYMKGGHSGWKAIGGPIRMQA